MMYSYSTKMPCSYAAGKFLVLSKNLVEELKTEGASYIECDDYVIRFDPDVSDEMRQRIVKEYGEYEKKRRESLTF